MTESMASRPISTDTAPAAIGPYSQGMIAGNFLFISGQLPFDPKSGELIEGDISEKTHRVIQNIEAIAKAAGAELHQVVKTTVFLADLSDFVEMNTVYGQYFDIAPPARSTIEVAALPKGADIEMEAIVCL